MVLPDSDGISRVPSYSGSTPEEISFRLQGCYLLWLVFQTIHLRNFLITPDGVSYNPRRQAFWFRLIPFRSPLLGKSRLLSLPPGTEMFQFPGCTLYTL